MKHYMEEQMNGITGLRVEAGTVCQAGRYGFFFVLPLFSNASQPLHHTLHEECPLSLVLVLTPSRTSLSVHLRPK